MTHDPDMQKEAIWEGIAARKRQMEADMRRDELIVPTGPELRKRRETGFALANTLTGQFQTIMEDPYITPDERCQRLLAWAHRNRSHIIAALRHGEGV